ASTLRNAAIIALYLFIINQSDGMIVTTFRWIFIVVLPITLIWAIINWFVERYEMSEKSFILYLGVWNKTEQTIPLYKVQNIHSKPNLFHRICKVTELTLETAASGDNDTVKFKVIAEKEAAKIKESLRQLRAEAAAEEKGAIEEQANEKEIDAETSKEKEVKHNRKIHYIPTKKELIYASFTSFNFLIIVPIVFLLYNVVEKFF